MNGPDFDVEPEHTTHESQKHTVLRFHRPEANMNEATEIISTFMEGLLKLFYSGGAAACHSQASCMRACTTSPLSSANATLGLTHSWHGGHLAQRSCSVGLDTARRSFEPSAQTFNVESPVAMPTKMLQYLQKVDIFDLLLNGTKRPGTKVMRPGTALPLQT